MSEADKYSKYFPGLVNNQDFSGKKVDVVIVGTGGGGGMAIKKLTEGGCTVVALERGGYVHGSTYPAPDELENMHFNRHVTNMDDYPQTWRPNASSVASKQTVIQCAEVVGGGVTHYATHCWRAHPADFERLTRYGPIPGANVRDWPISYDDLEPFYTEVEWTIGTSGDANLTNPFEPPHSRPYPNQPLNRKCSDMLIEKAASKVGMHVYPMPSCANSKKMAANRGVCKQCSFCSGYVCPWDAKGNSLTACMPAALSTGRLEVRIHSHAVQVLYDATGKCTGVEYIDTQTGAHHVQEANIVVLAATAPNTTKILLQSAGQHGLFPNGLGNSSGLLGKGYFTHISGAANALVDAKLDNYMGINGNSANQDFADPDPARGFIGGMASMVGGGMAPISGSQSLYPNSGAPSKIWGSDYKAYLRKNFGNITSFGMQCESTPMVTNVIDLDPTVKDKWGYPAVRFTTNTHPNDRLTTRFGSDRGKDVLNQLDGVVSVWGSGQPDSYIAKAGVHQGGTAVCGNDPNTSVTDKGGRFHDVPNLYVADGSRMCSMPPQCSSETIQALGLHTAQHILDSL